MIDKRGASAALAVTIGVIVITAVVVLVVYGKTSVLLGLLDTEKKVDEDRYISFFDGFVEVINGLLRDRERQFDQTEVFLEEGVALLFFDKDSDNIVAFSKRYDKYDTYIYAHKPIGEGCTQDRSCACACSRLYLQSYSVPGLERVKRGSDTVFEFACAKILSCKPLFVNKFVNKDSHRFTLEISQDLWKQDLHYSFPMNFQEGFFLVGAYGDYFNIEEDTPIISYKGIFVPKKDLGFWPWEIGPRGQVPAGFVYFDKKDNDIGICGELPCIGGV